jgi:hypothetical protein
LPKALKEPKYKVCKVEMQRQLDESEKEGVTFMSDDIDLRMSPSMSMTAFWNSIETLTDEMEKRLRDSQPTPEESDAEEQLDGSGRSGGSRSLGRMLRFLRQEPCQGSSLHGDATQESSSRDRSHDTSRSLCSASGEASGRDRQPSGGVPSWHGHGLGPSAAVPTLSKGRFRPVRVKDTLSTLSCVGDSASANSVITADSSSNGNVLRYPYVQDDLEEDPWIAGWITPGREEDKNDDDKNKADQRVSLDRELDETLFEGYQYDNGVS